MSHILGWAAVILLVAVGTGGIVALAVVPVPTRDTPEPSQPEPSWFLAEGESLPVPSVLEQTIPHAEVDGVPPWHPDADSLTTGHSLYHVEDLRKLLERGAS